MVLIELVYCKITGHTRALPKIHHFVPIAPWSVKKIKGIQKVMHVGDNRNDGPMHKFKGKEQIKLVLDMSNDGPTFKMLESLMAATAGGKGGKAGGYDALNKLLSSGIPGMEGLFSNDGKEDFSSRYAKMSDEDKKRFIAAVTGADGKVNSKAAAALIAAAASGGDPEIANKIIEKMMSGLGDDEIDPAMMAALMATTALVAQGASNEEIVKAMQRELANSGLSPEEILAKTMLLQKAMQGDNSPAFINKTLQNALNAANLSPSELAKALQIEKVMGATPSSPEDIAKALLLQSALARKGVSPKAIADAINKLTRSGSIDSLAKSIEKQLREASPLPSVKITPRDVAKAMTVAKSIDAEDLFGLKEILAGIKDGDLESPEDVAEAIKSAVESGKLDPAALQRLLDSSGLLDLADLSKCLVVAAALGERGVAAADGARLVADALASVSRDGDAEALAAAVRAALADDGIGQEDIFQAMLTALALSRDPSLTEGLKEIRADILIGKLASREQVEEALRKAVQSGKISREALDKFLSDSGCSENELAKSLLIEGALANSGVTVNKITSALETASLPGGTHDLQSAVRAITDALDSDRITMDDIAAAVAVARAVEGGGKVRGMKEMLAAIDEGGERGLDLSDSESLTSALLSAIQDGSLSAEVLRTSAVLQKALAASGASPETVAKMIALQKTLAESGMPKHEIANAMSLALSLGGADGKSGKPAIVAALAELVLNGITAEDVEALLKLTKAIEEGAEIPPEAVRLLKKAMKQRRGSVDNVAETLMATLAAGGESQESVARAMVKALKASGATPEEIAKTMAASMEKSGASNEEIARVLAQALADSGASGEEIAKTLKETFAKAMKDDPSAAADIARTMAVALAAAGASAEDIAETMKEALSAGLNLGSASPDDILDVVETVARAMAEAGASADEIAAAMKTALGATVRSPEIAEELTKAMAKSMALAGASGAEIAAAMKDALAANPHISKEEATQLLIGAVAASGASPEDIAKAMYKMMGDSGLSSEEMQQKIIDAMVESGASAEDVAKSVVQLKLLEAIGEAPEKMAKELLGAIRNGDEMTREKLEAILSGGGIGVEAAFRAALLQKALGRCGSDPEDVARAMLLQKAMVEAGASPENIAKVAREMASRAKGSLTPTAATVDALVSAIVTGGIEYDDVVKALNFDKAVEGGGGGANGSGVGMSEAARSLVSAHLSGAAAKDKIEAVAVELLSGGSAADANAMAATVLVEKVMSELAVSADDVAKFVRLQKAMYDSGATPQDIAMVLHPLLEGAPKEKLEAVAQMLRERLNESIGAADVANALDFVDAFQNASIPPELVGSMALVQKTIEASLSTPEKMSSGLAEMMKKSGANPESLEKPLRDLLKKNGVTAEGLEKAVLVQKAALACGLSSRDLSAVLALQAALAEAGWSAKEISAAFGTIASNGGDLKQIAGSMVSAVEQLRIKDDEVMVGCDLFRAAEGAAKETFEGVAFVKSRGKKGGQITAILQMALDMSKIEGAGMARALLLLKVMESSECPPSELAKVCRIENALIASGAPAGIVTKTIAAVLEPRNKSLIEKVKKPLLDIVNGAALELSAEAVSFGAKLTSAMTTNDHSAEQIRAVLDGALAVAGLADTDVAKAMLVQKAMTATGVTPEVMAQVVMLQKALAASGASPEEIAAILGKAAGNGLDDDEISSIMSAVMGNSDLSKEDVENMMNLQKSLKTGGFRKAGVTPEVMEQLVTLQKALEASGASPEEIAKALAQATSSDMSEAAVQDLMDKALNNSSIDRDDFKSVSGLQQSLKSGGLKAMGVTPEVMEQLVTLQKVLEASGKSKEEIAEIMAKATGEGLSESEISQVISKALESASSPEEQAKIKALEESLKGGKLKTGGMKAEVIGQVSLLQQALKDAGMSEKEVADILAKATSEGLSQEEISKVMGRILSNPEMSPEQRDRLMRLQDDLSAGNLRTAGMTRDKMEKLMALRRAMEVNGASEEEMNAVLAKATAGELSQKELDEIVTKAMANRNLSKAEKEKLRAVRESAASGGLKVGGVTTEAVAQMMLLQDALRQSGATEREIKEILDKAAKGQLTGDAVDDLMTKVLTAKNIARDEFDGMVKLQDSLNSGKLKTPGATSEVMEQIVLLQKALEATGASPEEVAAVIAKATGPGLSDEAISEIMSKVLNGKELSPEMREKMMGLQKNLKDGKLRLGNRLGDNIEELLASGAFDRTMLAKALLVQKILADSGLDPDDMGKAVLLQKALLEAGASPERIAEAMKGSLVRSGMSLEHMLTMMAIGLKSTAASGGGRSLLSARDVATMLRFERDLGAGSAATMILRKLNPEHLKLLETVAAKTRPGQPVDSKALIAAMKDALGDVLDDTTMKALEVSAVMESAGASKEEIEEMMTMIMNKGGGISQDFVENIKKAMAMGAGRTPEQTMEMLKDAMEEEMNSVTTCLRNTFLNRCPTEEDILRTCNTLAEKLSADINAKNDVKLALMDLLEEALQDVMDYEPDADMVFNYLMVSALAEATDLIEKKGMKPSGKDLQDLARKGMLDMIERLLNEAELPGELSKLSVYGRSLEGLKELLTHLLSHPDTGWQLRRQVAFLFDFEEVEHTTVLGLTLRDILKDARHKLRPWDLLKVRKMRGFRNAVVPNVAYSQVYCFYKVLPEHLEGPAIGLHYEEE